jgi:predicted amidohydrolase YtcJ
MRIESCFDSHVHWAAAGEFSQRLHLQELNDPAEILGIHPEVHHFRGEWLLGFGWDDNKWKRPPHRSFLDQWMADRPVALSRCDAHALWLNSAAIRLSGLEQIKDVPGGRIVRDEKGELTGLVIDQACDLVQKHIPKSSDFEIRRQLLKGVQIFNEAGFTHIRDMTVNDQQWNEAVKLSEAGLLTLAVESYFHVKTPESLGPVLKFLKQAREQRVEHLRPMGIKVFLDGALGSEGAWLSRCYHGRSHSGLVLWKDEPLSEVLRTAWEAGFAVAVHVIGDRAADHIVDLALKLKSAGHTGGLHLEHGELIRAETIEKMRALNVECHMQPAHWLNDQAWLKEKIGDLSDAAFPWRKLQEAGIRFDFGSDAPIEPASVTRTLKALRESEAAGVPRLLGAPETYMSHRDPSWVPNCYTLFSGDGPEQVVFQGEHIL